jgi:DNA-binding transcriptional ArsR family regulator
MILDVPETVWPLIAVIVLVVVLASKRQTATIEPMSERAQPAGDSNLAALGALLAEPARAKVLLALVDGRSIAASALATEAGVAASTASHHLARLVEAGLITVVSRGRHRYFTLDRRETSMNTWSSSWLRAASRCRCMRSRPPMRPSPSRRRDPGHANWRICGPTASRLMPVQPAKERRTKWERSS